MSALRLASPTQPVRFIDLGPATPAPLRGFSHRPHGIPGGSFCRPLPEPDDRRGSTERRRSQVAEAAARYRARAKEATA